MLKVELYVDDGLITTLLDPPYTFRWDAGDSLRSRRLHAKAYASDGTTSSYKITTRALQGTQKASVTLVQVYCTVRNRNGSYMMDLTRDDFTVMEAGVPQELAVFSAERKPAHMVLLIDSSASMKREDRLGVAQEAADGFVEALEPDDTAAVVSFSNYPELMQERTADKEALRNSIQSLEAGGGTALYDALVSGVSMLKGIDGRKAIILLSDGRDESTDGLGPGSVATFDQAMDAVLRSETAVYAIGTGEHLERDLDFHRNRTVGEILTELAGRSGGRVYFVKKAGKLKSAYRQVADELRHQYTLAYSPAETDLAGDGTVWRPITVRVSAPGARVTARDGYFR